MIKNQSYLFLITSDLPEPDQWLFDYWTSVWPGRNFPQSCVPDLRPSWKRGKEALKKIVKQSQRLGLFSNIECGGGLRITETRLYSICMSGGREICWRCLFNVAVSLWLTLLNSIAVTLSHGNVVFLVICKNMWAKICQISWLGWN